MITRITFVRILLLFVLSLGPVLAETSFPEEPVFGQVKLPEGQGLLAAVGIGVRVSAPSLHLKERVKLNELPLPSYPAALLNGGITGKCDVLFELNEDGSVTHVRVGHSANPEFGDAAVAAVKKWKLEPLQNLSGPEILTVTAVFVFSIYNE